MYAEYGTACATSASGVYNLGGGVRKSGVRISPLPPVAAPLPRLLRRRSACRGPPAAVTPAAQAPAAPPPCGSFLLLRRDAPPQLDAPARRLRRCPRFVSPSAARRGSSFPRSLAPCLPPPRLFGSHGPQRARLPVHPLCDGNEERSISTKVAERGK